MINLKKYEFNSKKPKEQDFLIFTFLRGTQVIRTAFTAPKAIELGFEIFKQDISFFVRHSNALKYESRGYIVHKQINTESYNAALVGYQEKVKELETAFKEELLIEYPIKNKKKIAMALDLAFAYGKNDYALIETLFSSLAKLLNS